MNKKRVWRMDNIVMLDHLDHFDIKQILESGQVFRYEQLSEHSYLLIAKQRLIKITQQPEATSVIFHHIHSGEIEEIWQPYFDLNTDYKEITRVLSQKDEFMAKAIAFGKGIRILKQDPWEMLISFIISQNKGIPHIRKCIEQISESFGTPIYEDYHQERCAYAFPTPQQLAQASSEALRSCKVGFRAPYIIDACQKIITGEIVLSELYVMSREEAKEKLMTIKGVGPKVADCILLFAYGKAEVFPTDVWIKRVIEGVYFKGEEKKLEEIQQFASGYFGTLAGYAQQYIFYYGRENALFK